MKSMHLRFGLAAIICGIIAAALLLAVPPTTNAAAIDHQTVQSAQPQQGAFCTVTVQRGEALYMIAARFRTTTAYLAALNNLFNPNYIYAGMVLKVPCAPQPWPQPQPQPQPHPQPQPGPGICTYYIVQRGDWLKTIAWRFGVSWQAIAQANGLHNANYIYAGQRLAIPCAQPIPPVCPGCPPCQGCPPPVPPPQPPVCPGCPPCQGCPPPVYPTQPPPPTAIPVYANVEIRDDFFVPPVITVRQYQFVQWTNRGNRPHTVTQGLCPGGQCAPTPGGFNSGVLNPGATFGHQFTQLGTFAYFDAASGVGGTVAVVP
ncbi:MAG: LysM peptidoglycan-binding domain-containing protein [Chloroflexota bacterium]|nr:MAG: LysM peptidoglycan-binding domain-containing protein [Chloroflexota bacterium]